MKKLFFVWSISMMTMWSCNDNSDTSSTTSSDTTTTAMDNVSSTTGESHMDTMNHNAEGEKMSSNNMPADSATTDFVAKAASGGMMEIALGNMAKDKAKSQRVKDFAKMIVDDHTAASNELKSTATSNNITVPSAMMPDHMHHVEMMKDKSGAAFDKEYMSMMVTDHKKDIGAYKKASMELKNEAIKSFAGKTLPTLQKHLDSAQVINKKM